MARALMLLVVDVGNTNIGFGVFEGTPGCGFWSIAMTQSPLPPMMCLEKPNTKPRWRTAAYRHGGAASREPRDAEISACCTRPASREDAAPCLPWPRPLPRRRRRRPTRAANLRAPCSIASSVSTSQPSSRPCVKSAARDYRATWKRSSGGICVAGSWRTAFCASCVRSAARKSSSRTRASSGGHPMAFFELRQVVLESCASAWTELRGADDHPADPG